MTRIALLRQGRSPGSPPVQQSTMTRSSMMRSAGSSPTSWTPNLRPGVRKPTGKRDGFLWKRVAATERATRPGQDPLRPATCSTLLLVSELLPWSLNTVVFGRKVSQFRDDLLGLSQIWGASVAAGKMFLKSCLQVSRERIVQVVGHQFYELLA